MGADPQDRDSEGDATDRGELTATAGQGPGEDRSRGEEAPPHQTSAAGTGWERTEDDREHLVEHAGHHRGSESEGEDMGESECLRSGPSAGINELFGPDGDEDAPGDDRYAAEGHESRWNVERRSVAEAEPEWSQPRGARFPW